MAGWSSRNTCCGHACGCALADQGAHTGLIRDCLRHGNIQHAVKYTAANPGAVPEALAVTAETG
jgi:hypothetical protein